MTQINITTAIVINRAIEIVFDYIQDLKNHAKFSTEFLDNFRYPTENTTGLGASLKCTIKFTPFSVPAYLSISQLSYPDKLVEEGTQGGKYIKMMWNLLAIDNEHTAVNIVMSYEVNSVLSESAIEIVQNQISCAYYRALFKLKKILENAQEFVKLANTSTGFSNVKTINSQQV